MAHLWGGNMSKDLGLVLRTLRNNCTLTQQQVADALHLDRSTYAYYERGTTEPELKTVKKLAAIFNVDPTLLLPDDDGKFVLRVSDVTVDEQGTVAQENEEEAVEPRGQMIYALSRDEKAFLAHYRVLTSEQKEKLKLFFENLDE